MGSASFLTSGDPADCTGCAACAHACPTGAIDMSEDPCGFEYPVVDKNKCVHCDKCLRSCHMGRCDALKATDAPRAFGAYVRNGDSLMRSASGGIATALCEGALGRGGVAYGCVARREEVRHERLASRGDLDRARGSKYVQSDVSGTYAQVAADLRAGVPVAFVGTPCQCAAIRTLFGDHEGLLLVDLVCEGVPSRRMYAGFLDDLEAERGEAVSDFRFRDKRGGWSTKNAVVLGEGGRPLEEQPHSYYYYYYYYLFARALTLRESCYACPYACKGRVGDVTVGDFWGAESAGLGYGLRELRGGVSCALANTEKGGAALTALGDSADLRPCSFEVIARSNACLMRPSGCDFAARESVLAAYAARGAAGMRAAYVRTFGPAARFRARVVSSMPLAARVLAKRAAWALKGVR